LKIGVQLHAYTQRHLLTADNPIEWMPFSVQKLDMANLRATRAKRRGIVLKLEQLQIVSQRCRIDELQPLIALLSDLLLDEVLAEVRACRAALAFAPNGSVSRLRTSSTALARSSAVDGPRAATAPVSRTRRLSMVT